MNGEKQVQLAVYFIETRLATDAHPIEFLLYDRFVHDAGTFLDVLHNSYVKCGLAMVALFGPGRGILGSNISFKILCICVLVVYYSLPSKISLMVLVHNGGSSLCFHRDSDGTCITPYKISS